MSLGLARATGGAAFRRRAARGRRDDAPQASPAGVEEGAVPHSLAPNNSFFVTYFSIQCYSYLFMSLAQLVSFPSEVLLHAGATSQEAREAPLPFAQRSDTSEPTVLLEKNDIDADHVRRAGSWLHR